MASPAVHGVVAVLLLMASNCFMTTAWYLHLRFTSWSLVKAVFLSWCIALPEYALQVPANRLGHFSGGGPFSAPQLKVIQECISLSAFAVFSVLVLKEKLRWRDLGAFVLILAGVAVAMIGKPEHAAPPPPRTVVPPPPPLPSEAGRRLLHLPTRPAEAGRPASGGGSSNGKDSPVGTPAGLPAGDAAAAHVLRGSGSARVLQAGGIELAASRQPGVRRRDTHDAEAAGAEARGEHVAGQAQAGTEGRGSRLDS